MTIFGFLVAVLIIMYASLSIKVAFMMRSEAVFSLRNERLIGRLFEKFGDTNATINLNENLDERADVIKSTNITFYINIISYYLMCIIAIISLL